MCIVVSLVVELNAGVFFCANVPTSQAAEKQLDVFFVVS